MPHFIPPLGSYPVTRSSQVWLQAGGHGSPAGVGPRRRGRGGPQRGQHPPLQRLHRRPRVQAGGVTQPGDAQPCLMGVGRGCEEEGLYILNVSALPCSSRSASPRCPSGSSSSTASRSGGPSEHLRPAPSDDCVTAAWRPSLGLDCVKPDREHKAWSLVLPYHYV